MHTHRQAVILYHHESLAVQNVDQIRVFEIFTLTSRLVSEMRVNLQDIGKQTFTLVAVRFLPTRCC